LANPYLAPLAVLANCEGQAPTANLAKVAAVLDSQPPELAAFLSPISQILASKIFDKNTIQTYFARMILREFPLAQELIGEGRVEGRVEGQLRSVLQVLEARFGELPDAMLAPLRSTTDTKVLDAILLIALTATSPAEVLAALPRSS
jgi:hypothetical protein